ncbi:GlcG/HbpS family heme-binding protein [Gluconacetobacter asukensis]|uniref:Heme-binding protein n=1 Tax=Gluconacetobacter asukensis TaxID=1017181 RepID=A0A7W4P4B7_9PROT|nr:heme-binding protein [Gluconacetobacter asukensis]MBB2173595.1 heme-binding protein [Gluconacetobacter asukensis]
MKIRHLGPLAVLALFPAFAAAHADEGKLLTRAILSSEGAKSLLNAAEADAKQRGMRVSIAIVDGSGRLLAFTRMDDSQTGTDETAIKKARTAALYSSPGKEFSQRIKQNQAFLMTLPGITAVPGSHPVMNGKYLIGAVGVSGATDDLDDAVATDSATSFRP